MLSTLDTLVITHTFMLYYAIGLIIASQRLVLFYQ